jgi:hypothetical protein
MYGNGTLELDDINQPVSEWVFVPPPPAPASASEFLFKPNELFDQGFFIGIEHDQPYTAVTASAEDDAFLWFFAAVGPSPDEAISMNATFVLVDPFGYIYNTWNVTGDCEVLVSCSVVASITTNKVMKTLPGEWTFYLIDNDTETTLHEFTFNVNTIPTISQPPVATFIDVLGTSLTSADVTLTVSDPDSDTISIIWNQQGDLGDVDKDGFRETSIIDTVPSGTTIKREVRFAASLDQTLFVELTDGDTRYESDESDSSVAGDGFQSLIAIDLHLPISTSDDIRIRTSYDLSSPPGNDQAAIDAANLAAIAGTNNLELVTSTDSGATTARFGAGATPDDGLTTRSIFAAGEEVLIAGSVTPRIGDAGMPGEIFVVLSTGTSLTYLDVNGNFINWDGNLNGLQPAFVKTGLKSVDNFEVFSGSVQSGQYRLFLGYRLTEDGPLHFNTKAFRITVD